MNLAIIIHYFMTTVSLVTALGVFAHDTRIDKAGPSLLGSMSMHKSQLTKTTTKFTDFGSAPDPHTHSHHSSGKALLSGFVYQSPSIAPRRKSHHRELFHQTARPHFAFDNASLPLLA
ncbi:MAG: hypothetical protein WBP12_04805 [Candidatus Saccharimonas sp.]